MPPKRAKAKDATEVEEDLQDAINERLSIAAQIESIKRDVTSLEKVRQRAVQSGRSQ